MSQLHDFIMHEKKFSFTFSYGHIFNLHTFILT